MEIIDPKDAEKNTVSVESIKASQRTRSHLNNAGTIGRTFGSMDELLEKAEEIYGSAGKAMVKEHEKDKENGFDINDVESIKNFNIDYTPLGNSVVVKFIREDLKLGEIIVPDTSNHGRKAVIMVAGLYVDTLKRGDIVRLRPMAPQRPGAKINQDELPPSVDIIFNNVKFSEISYEAVAGVFLSREVVNGRLNPSK